jgi:hypothetical protein
METVVGLFESLEDANKAVKAMRKAGISKEGVSVLGPRTVSEAQPGEEQRHSSQSETSSHVIDAFASLVMPHDSANLYAEGVRRGGMVVVAHVTSNSRVESVNKIMARAGAVDVHHLHPAWLSRRYNRFAEREQDLYSPVPLLDSLHEEYQKYKSA